MREVGPLPQTLPIFPLSGVLLLPGADLRLNIFEPRYLAMVDDAMRDHRLIGMIQPRDDDEPTPALYDIGCAGRLTSFSETEDGRYIIALTGVTRFRVVEEIDGFTPFRRVTPDWGSFADDLDAPKTDVSKAERKGFLELLRRYFEAASLPADWSALAKADDETLVNTLAMLCPFGAQEKQALLEARSLTERKQNLRALMQFAIAGEPGDGEMQ